MTDQEFERWWRQHIAVAFPNVRSWLANQCTCDGGHDKATESCPSSAIKRSWRAVVADCEIDDAMRATDDCQRDRAFRSVMSQDHPAEIRSLALSYAAARRPVVASDDFVPLSETTTAQRDIVRGEMRHAMRTLAECSEMREKAMAAGLGDLTHDDQRYWAVRIADAARTVEGSGDDIQDHADRVISSVRLIHRELTKHLEDREHGTQVCSSDGDRSHATTSSTDRGGDHQARQDEV